MNDILKEACSAGILPVIKIDDPENAEPLAKAIYSGGIHTIEVTVRNSTAFQSIERIKRVCPDMLVGAGTITSPQLAKQAQEAGADYVVSPGFYRPTVQYCVECGLPILPGCVTPSEIQAAQEEGFQMLKFFPAAQNGGTDGIKQLSGPFPNVRFVPTGGIGYNELGAYLRCKAVAAVGGSFMAKADVIHHGDWHAITENCRRAVAISLDFRLAHVGIHHDNAEEASAAASVLSRILHTQAAESANSFFTGRSVEHMKGKLYGEKGHIGFYTNSLERAISCLRRDGVEFREESRQYNAAGELTCIYLKEEIAGFAVHLIEERS